MYNEPIPPSEADSYRIAEVNDVLKMSLIKLLALQEYTEQDNNHVAAEVQVKKKRYTLPLYFKHKNCFFKFHFYRFSNGQWKRAHR